MSQHNMYLCLHVTGFLLFTIGIQLLCPENKPNIIFNFQRDSEGKFVKYIFSQNKTSHIFIFYKSYILVWHLFTLHQLTKNRM